MKFASKFVLFSFAFSILLDLSCLESSAANGTDSAEHPAYISVNGKAGSHKSLGEIDLIIPFFQNNGHLLFLNFRGQRADQSAKDYNFALGLRKLISLFSFDCIGGVYLAKDIKKTRFDNTFHQFTFGFEILANFFEWRANVYRPSTGKKPVTNGNLTSGMFVLGGNEVPIFVTTSTPFTIFECPLKGFDTEIGGRLPYTFKGPFSWLNNWQLWGFVGVFHLSARQAPDMKGQRIRIELVRPDVFASSGVRGARLMIKGEIIRNTRRNPVSGNSPVVGVASPRKSRKTSFFAAICLSIPLVNPKTNNAPTSGLGYKLVQRIIRDVD